jgi:aryl carrier-like protein
MFENRHESPRQLVNMDVRAELVEQFTQVAREQDKKLEKLTDQLNLLDSGLDSLCFAILVARLDVKLGVDPFSTSEDTYLPITFGDLVKFYENAIAS